VLQREAPQHRVRPQCRPAAGPVLGRAGRAEPAGRWRRARTAHLRARFRSVAWLPVRAGAGIPGRT